MEEELKTPNTELMFVYNIYSILGNCKLIFLAKNLIKSS